MSFESEQENRRRLSRESRESSAEFRENKEGEVDEELQKAAAMERADLVIKEVNLSITKCKILIEICKKYKSNSAVESTITISTNNDDPVSVVQTKKN